MDLISVIVPIYKVEKFIKPCIDSILASTYQNLEVILVDDGSPDRCGAICDEYADKDSRVRVIHQENKGLPEARNAGLSVANGTYISFIDSDDYISPVFYEIMEQQIRSLQADVVACESCRDIKSLVTTTVGHFYSHITDDFDEKLALITTAPSVRKVSWTGCNVWNKFYRRSAIGNIRFRPESLMCEDIRFNLEVISSCGKIAVIPLPLYFYRINGESIMADYRKSVSRLEHGICHAEQWRLISESPVNSEELQVYLTARAVYMAHGAMWRICALGKDNEYEAYVRQTRALIQSGFSCLMKEHSSYNFTIKAAIFACRFVFPFWKIVARLSCLPARLVKYGS